MSRRLKAARPNLLTRKTAQATQALPRHFFLAWAVESTVVIGFQADCPGNPPFFLIQWEKKDRGYKKEKRINPPSDLLHFTWVAWAIPRKPAPVLA